jgi:hypothetical protein
VWRCSLCGHVLSGAFGRVLGWVPGLRKACSSTAAAVSLLTPALTRSDLSCQCAGSRQSISIKLLCRSRYTRTTHLVCDVHFSRSFPSTASAQCCVIGTGLSASLGNKRMLQKRACNRAEGRQRARHDLQGPACNRAEGHRRQLRCANPHRSI